MLTKQAQEELYNTYYNQGVDLALGQVKVAGKTKEVIKKMIQLPAVAYGGAAGFQIMPLVIRNLLDLHGAPEAEALANYLTHSGVGAAAVGAYKGTGKAVDLADAGIQKLLKKIKKKGN